jgi:triacylglycerol esterase/lipase EstA (alpha/beta hydrolase family)
MIRHVKMKTFIYATALSIIIFLSSLLALAAPLGLNEFNDGQWITPDLNQNGKKIALIVSGYNDTIERCHALATYLGTKNFDTTMGFEYSSYKSIDDNARLLAHEVKTLAQNNQIFIVAHSMGGIVARYALEQLDLAENIHYLLMLGTPNEGIPGNALSGPFLFGARIFKLPGQSLAQLFAGGVFLNALNDGISPYRETSNYYAIQGTKQNGAFPVEMQPFRSVVAYLLHAFKIYQHDGLVPCYADETSPLRRKSASWNGHFTVEMGHFELKYNLDRIDDSMDQVMESWNTLD